MSHFSANNLVILQICECDISFGSFDGCENIASPDVGDQAENNFGEGFENGVESDTEMIKAEPKAQDNENSNGDEVKDGMKRNQDNGQQSEAGMNRNQDNGEQAEASMKRNQDNGEQAKAGMNGNQDNGDKAEARMERNQDNGEQAEAGMNRSHDNMKS